MSDQLSVKDERSAVGSQLEMYRTKITVDTVPPSRSFADNFGIVRSHDRPGRLGRPGP